MTTNPEKSTNRKLVPFPLASPAFLNNPGGGQPPGAEKPAGWKTAAQRPQIGIPDKKQFDGWRGGLGACELDAGGGMPQALKKSLVADGVGSTLNIILARA